MFGGRKAGHTGLHTGLESAPASFATDAHMTDPRRAASKGSKQKLDDRDHEAGHCATCETRVRWPRGVAEFRCPTCLMINDLKPLQPSRTSSRDQGPQGMGRSGTSPALPTHIPKAMPLTLERTKAIITRCVDTYLETRRNHKGNPALNFIGTPPQSPGKLQHQHLSPQRSPQRPGAYQDLGSPVEEGPTTPSDDRGYPQHFHFDESPKHPPLRAEMMGGSVSAPPHGRTIARKPVPASGDQAPAHPFKPNTSTPTYLNRPSEPVPSQAVLGSSPGRDPALSPGHEERAAPHFIPAPRIFKPLENFLAHNYGEHESLNASFFSANTRLRPAVRPSEDGRTSRDRSQSKPSRHAEGNIQELDAKMLLLGDFAENGLWWTGSGERPIASARRAKPDVIQDKLPEKAEARVGSKSPLISWPEVETWYDAVLGAGSDWQERARFLQLASDSDLGSIEQAFAEGRAHLHRAILKMTESLLKRPGRPLKESSDIRFLLLILANPLLYPQAQAPHSFDHIYSGAAFRDIQITAGAGRPRFESAWEQGNAFGIVKRVFGLLSNLSGDCHRHLTSWFARYDESRFRSFVDLVQRFLTYRLKRQHGRKRSNVINPVAGLIPNLSGTSADTSAQLHAALSLGTSSKAAGDSQNQYSSYSDDWQVKAAAKVMAMLFSANRVFYGQRSASTVAQDDQMSKRGSISRTHIKNHGQLLSTTDFYNSMVDLSDIIADFDTWESSKSRFAFCQYPFFLSVGSKIRLIQHDARRQMDIKAREAFFDSILKNKALEQYLVLKVRRDCLVEDSLNGISEVVGATSEDIKKGLKVQFVGEEGIDAGGLRKEWFLLLIREIFNPSHGLFLYDDESPFCYFNPHSFETSDRYYLVGAVLGLAIYNSTILDVALPPFVFKKLLSSAVATTSSKAPFSRSPIKYTLKDLAEYKPALARGLRQLLEFDGDVRETFQRDFVIEVERYGTLAEVPLCDNGAARAVTNANRAEFVELYIRYILDTQVARQFEPFKRGFFTVCAGNALSLFQPEEIELLVRGSEEPLDVPSLRAVAIYDNWKDPASGRPVAAPAEHVPLLVWFWELFAAASPADQRKILGFITGSDRIPALGATNLVIKVAFAGPERNRLPIARTCFNLLLLYDYRSKAELSQKLWTAVLGSEGFGLK